MLLFDTHANMHTHTHTHTHIHTHTYIHTQTHQDTDRQTHTQTHTYIHKHTQTHTRFILNTLNLALGGIYVLHKIKYPIASGGHSPPDPLLQRSTTVISPPSQKILDVPLTYTKHTQTHTDTHTQTHTHRHTHLFLILVTDGLLHG